MRKDEIFQLRITAIGLQRLRAAAFAVGMSPEVFVRDAIEARVVPALQLRTCLAEELGR